MAALVGGNDDPKSASAALGRLVNYGAVLSNLGRFPALAKVRNFRVTAMYPVHSVEVYPIAAIATAHGRMSVTITSDKPTGADWMRSFLKRLQSAALA